MVAGRFGESEGAAGGAAAEAREREGRRVLLVRRQLDRRLAVVAV